MLAKIYKIEKNAELPKYQTKDSAGFDLVASQDMKILKGMVGKVPTGLAIEAPKNHFLFIAARGSLFLKKGLVLANSVGIIDRDYFGPSDEIFLLLLNLGQKTALIKKGERLAQGIFIKIDQVKWHEVKAANPKNRGGFGSTGGYAHKN